MSCKAAEALGQLLVLLGLLLRSHLTPFRPRWQGCVSHRAFAWSALHRNSCMAPSLIFFRFLLNITLLEAFHDYSMEIRPFNSFFLPSPLFYITLMIWHLAVHCHSAVQKHHEVSSFFFFFPLLRSQCLDHYLAHIRHGINICQMGKQWEEKRTTNKFIPMLL